MIRRPLAALACVALGAVVFPASAAPLKACTKFTDAKGDSVMTLQVNEPPAPPSPEVPVTPVRDPALDIISVVFKPAGKGLAMAITVDKLTERPAYATGNRYQLDFSVGADEYTVYYKNSATRSQEAEVFYQSGVRTNGTFSHADVSATFSGNTITLILSGAALKTTFGSKAVGSKITKIKATAFASYVADNEYYDVATAPGSMRHVIGAACT